MSETRITNPSERTIAERNKFLASLDDFATFKWANVDMLDNFGAFIINEKKGSLKLYNGASFTNNYTKQQFQDGYTNLSGVTFSTQQITFTIGVYWISIQDYRILMNLLHPYTVDMLQFSFDKKYGYKCKLSNVKDSTRYVLGKEGTPSTSVSNKLLYAHLEDHDGEGYRYYTELTLTFDVIGAQCARQIEPTIIEFNDTNKIDLSTYTTSLWPSDLEFPITIECTEYKVTNTSPHIKFTGYIYDTETDHVVGDVMTLFDIGLQNLVVNTKISLTYNSEQGLLYWRNGNKQQLLTLLSVNNEGRRFVKFFTDNRFFMPGRLDYPEVDNQNYCFYIEMELTGITFDSNSKTTCIAAARTNVI